MSDSDIIKSIKKLKSELRRERREIKQIQRELDTRDKIITKIKDASSSQEALFNFAKKQRDTQDIFINLMFDSSPDFIALIDNNRRFVLGTANNFMILGISPDVFSKTHDEDFIKNLSGVFSIESYNNIREKICGALERGETYKYNENSLLKNDILSNFDIFISPFTDSSGAVTGAMLQIHDVTKLNTAVENAKAATKAKSRFLATMSHETRTPMNAIIGIAQIELYKKYLPAECTQALKLIFNSGKALLELINNILKTAKMDSGSDEMNLTDLHISREPMPYGKVLIVDDIETNLYVAKGLLAPYHLNIETANSGVEALRLIEKGNKYHIIFMDHLMPEMNGIETVKKLREMGYDNPIVALTATALLGQMDKFLKNGFNAVISKPIEVRRLDVILNKMIRDKQSQDTLETVRQWAETLKLDTPEPEISRLSEKVIPGLDIIKGLKRYHDDELNYITVLRIYSTNIRTLLRKIEVFNMLDLLDYKITVHGIKGASYDIYISDVGDKALALEQAADAEDFEYILNAHADFIETTHEFLDRLDKLLVEVDSGDEKQEKEKPDEELLLRLQGRCSDYDIDGAEEVMEEISQYRYLHENDLVEWLQEKVKMTYLSDIEDKLKARGGVNE